MRYWSSGFVYINLATIGDYLFFSVMQKYYSQPTITGICVQDGLFTEVWMSEDEWSGIEL